MNIDPDNASVYTGAGAFAGIACRLDRQLYIAEVTPELLETGSILTRGFMQDPDLERRSYGVKSCTGWIDEIEGLLSSGWRGGALRRDQLEHVMRHLEAAAAPRRAWWLKHRRPWSEMPRTERTPPAPPERRIEPVVAPEPAGPDEVTFGLAPDGGSLAKLVLGGQVIGASHRLEYRWAVEPVTSPADLLRVLERAAELGAFAVRGRPLAAVGRRAFKDHPVKGPAGLEAVPRRWAALDWEGFGMPGVDPLDGAAVARALLPCMPPEMARADLVWQLTAGAGIKEGIRARTWHWLDRALSTAELKAWLAPLFTGDEPMIDPSTLESVQPIFLGVTGGPQVRRFGILQGQTRTVAVPAIDLPAARRRGERRGAGRSGATEGRARPGPSCRTRSRQADPRVREQVHQCLVAIRAARGQEGQRWPVFKRQAARAVWLAAGAGMSLTHVDDLLLRAGTYLYEGDREHMERNIVPYLVWLREKS